MTKKFAVIGHPIEHSLSPEMYCAGFTALGLDASYERVSVAPENLPEAIGQMKEAGYSGWNVTIPHKVAIIPFLDEMTKDAERAGAVNTVKVAEGRLIGHNTDGSGFWQSLGDTRERLRGKEAVILGAGGAARGIAFTLAEQKMKIWVLNRTLHKAEELAQAVNKAGGEAVAGELDRGEWLNSAALIVQTTSIGLKEESYPFSLQGIPSRTLVADIIFNPWKTRFLKEAEELGCLTENGLGMLLYQGTLAWEFWWGSRAPAESMRAGLIKALNHGNKLKR